METKIISKKKELPPVDCNDDEMMVKLKLRPSFLEINKQVFVKTQEEKDLISKLKKSQGLSSTKSIFRRIHRTPYHRLIVHVYNEKKDNKFHTTFNYICREHEIKDIIELFHSKQTITKVRYAGKEINYEK